jgi:hypothetical protein
MLSRAIKQTVGGHDLEASGGLNISDDVKQEQDRILSQLAGPQESRDAVIIKDIHKVWINPEYSIICYALFEQVG